VDVAVFVGPVELVVVNTADELRQFGFSKRGTLLVVFLSSKHTPSAKHGFFAQHPSKLEVLERQM
jgi:hypothetical protein